MWISSASCRQPRQQALCQVRTWDLWREVFLLQWRVRSAACFCTHSSLCPLHAGRTTNYRRTVNTLGYLVAGLYESADAAIPVVTATELDEILFGNAKACEQLARLMSSQRRALKGGWLGSE